MFREQLAQLFRVQELEGHYWLGGDRGLKALLRVPNEETLARHVSETSPFSAPEQLSLIAQDVEALCASGSKQMVLLVELGSDDLIVIADGLKPPFDSAIFRS